MKAVFVLGAGMVSRPLVTYLLNRGYAVTLGDLNQEQAVRVINGHPNGTALHLDINDEDQVRKLVVAADLVVSLLPPMFHIRLARMCLQEGRNFLTASYLSSEMEALDDDVAGKDLIFLNEVGLDPGLDHLTAMEMIDTLKGRGYKILGFDSHCGGIPSRKAANNPLRYKLSWSPAGVLGAITRASRFRRDGKLMEVPGEHKLQHAEVLHVPGEGIFESNPNADSLFYGDRYGLDDVPTVRRGTLRYPGWAQFWLFMISLGFHDREKTLDFDDTPVLEALFRLAGNEKPFDIYTYVADKAHAHASLFLEYMESLGFLDENNRVTGSLSCFQIILGCMEKSMQYDEGERDLVILHHEMIAEKDGVKEKWTSTMVREGNEKDTAMAFLVGVPAAIAARMILEGKISSRGVMIPLKEEIYAPILKELAELGLPHEIHKTTLPG